jgi:hypothetical protein
MKAEKGRGPLQIAKQLQEEKILVPSAYYEKSRYLLYCGWYDRYSNRTGNSCYDGRNTGKPAVLAEYAVSG